jgi:hypothetical protein
MSVVQYPVSSRPFSVSRGLNRLLLFCRFDFRQKTWALPAPAILRDHGLSFPGRPVELASAISKNLSDFSDPSLGGYKPPKAVTRRIGIRHSLRGPLGKPKTKN